MPFIDRRHAELAHAVVQVVAGARLARRSAASPWQTVRFDPVRSAEPPRSSGSAGDQVVQRVLRGLARRDRSRPRAPSSKSASAVSRPARRQLAAPCGAGTRRRARDAPRRRRRSACCQSRLALRRRACARVPCRAQTSAGTSNGACGPAERRARAGDLVRAERRAVHVVRAGLVRRALADDGPAADQRRPVGGSPRARARCAASSAAASWPSTPRDHVPAVGLEALRRVVGEPARDVAVDRDAVVVVEHDELAEAAACRRASRPRAMTPSIRQPSPTNT